MTTNEILGVWGFFVGVFSFVLALAHVVWQMWWQHWQTRERIRAEIAWEPQPHVWVYNAGMIPVYLAGVELVIGTARKQIPLQAVIKRPALPNESGGLGHEQWQLTGQRTPKNPLERGAAHEFVLTKQMATPSLTTGSTQGAYIAVRSNAGELCRVKGKAVMDYLGSVLSDTSPQTPTATK